MNTRLIATAGIFVTAFLTCACATSNGLPGREVIFREAFSLGRSSFNETGTEIWVPMGDVVWTLTKCRADEEFICVRSDLPHSFPFAISRNPAVREWDFEGNHYRVWDDQSDPMPQGTRMIVVDPKPDGDRFWFLYSYDRGVLAYSWQLSSRDSRPWWMALQGKIGILASPLEPKR